MVKSIIFDLGNVILGQETYTVRHYFSKILKTDGIESDKFILGFKRRIDTGTMKFDELFRLYKDRFNVSDSYETLLSKYKEAYLSDVKGIDPEMIGLVKKLSFRYSLYIMTNTVAPHYESLKEEEFAPYFKRVFRSDTDHFVKPEVQAFEYVLGEIENKAEECVFIDDLEANVSAANKVGMKGIVFKNRLDLEDDLKKIGVII